MGKCLDLFKVYLEATSASYVEEYDDSIHALEILLWRLNLEGTLGKKANVEAVKLLQRLFVVIQVRSRCLVKK